LELDGINTDDVFNDLSSSIYEAYEIITSIGNLLQFSDKPNSWWFLCSLQYASLIFLGLLVFLINARRSVKESSKIDTDNKERSCYKLRMLFVSIAFALFAILAWVAASTFFAGATLTADFCHSEISTGEGIQQILKQKGFDFDSYIYMIFDGYLHECVYDNSVPYDLFETYDKKLAEAEGKGSNFVALSNDGNMTDLIAVCGSESTTVIELTTSVLDSISQSLSDIHFLKSTMSCKSLAPLMQETVYEYTCQSLITSAVWNFASFFTLAIFTTLILTLRSAIKRPQMYIMPSQNDIIFTKL